VSSVAESDSESFAVAGVSREYLLHHRVCPDKISGDGALIVATGPGAFLEAIPELADIYERPVVTRQVADDDLERMIERITAHAENGSDPVRTGEEDTADVREIANQPPVIRYVNTLLHDAYEAGASDVHIESTRGGAVARVRVDGLLAPTIEPPRRLHEAVVSRIKLLADLDISERRRPQDGRIRVRVDNTELYLRVSTVPTVYGESVVLRLLDRGTRPVDLTALGMPDDILREMASAIDRPHGMVLVTGPTGSGKTTTLYSALRRRDIQSEKVVTVEDPVEYQLEGVTQVPVHRQAGVTFASALRSILRQDPDVVMIGEMRDTETAEIAIQASMTGHLVFSTLHTNDAIGALPRLFDLGIAPYLVAATLTAIQAQRLVRIACPACKSPCELRSELVDLQRSVAPEIPVVDFVRTTGCPLCRGTGFKGRIGIFEIVAVDDEMRAAIARRASSAELKSLADERGYRPMLADGIAKAARGITTMDEVLRVCNA
jgi:general secretion pathway protein E